MVGYRAEDYVLWLNYLKNNKIKFINKPLLKYRIHDLIGQIAQQLTG
jgi:hypothetical protein